MTTPASTALRGALITLAKADATLATLMGGAVKIWEHVPENAVHPYLELRASGTRAWDTTGDRGKEHEVSVNCWSHEEGSKQCEAILGRLEEIWRDQRPTIADHRVVNLELQFADIIREEGGQTYHGFQRWRAVTEEV